MQTSSAGTASVTDDISAGPQATAVNPDTAGIKPPTRGDHCGTPSGKKHHAARGERSCQECVDAYNDAYARWTAEAAERQAAEMAERAARRPSMAAILDAHGVQDPVTLILALEQQGYGDYADALLEAARDCPIPNLNNTTGGAVKGWLRGRAAIIQKAL